ncbi:MAG: hypothetical protein QMD43_06320 [Thermodesulfovibrio sp.]|jgi:hypothetical protein|nr:MULTISPECIES: hypothetical protein [unclassified Thermodesulfovibrio]MDI1471350.1 hypothetical protein [Thermodesulfovibrio sp. 1176]MDI6714624.1 hypothetical protein [Thermodesulfovibrio sp.]ODA44304.1 hypothetical protein THER_0928 [Thermodesulfovibrio sp. N1]
MIDKWIKGNPKSSSKVVLKVDNDIMKVLFAGRFRTDENEEEIL